MSFIRVSLAFLLWTKGVFSTTAFVCDDDFDCYPNGTCGPDLTCLCDPGFFGTRCEDPCPLQCQNGGQCVVTEDHGGLIEASEFRCDCPSTHAGGLCEDTAPFVCEDDFDCYPHGTCDTDDLSCVCGAGYTGTRCDQPCPLSCQNGGTCVVVNDHGGFALANEYYCDCPTGYGGGLCQKLKSTGTAPGGGSVTNNDDGDSPNRRARTAGIIVFVLIAFSGLVMAVWRPARCRRSGGGSRGKMTSGESSAPERRQATASSATTGAGPEDAQLPAIA